MLHFCLFCLFYSQNHKFLFLTSTPSPSYPCVHSRGSPGTGKTTVGRLLAKALYKLGFLASDHVEEWAG